MRVRLVREKTRHVCKGNFEIKRRRRMEESETNKKGEALKQPTKYIRVITISLSLSVSPFLYSSMRRSLSSLSLFPFARGKSVRERKTLKQSQKRRPLSLSLSVTNPRLD